MSPKTMKRRPCLCRKPVLWELNYNGIEATTPAEKADLFNYYFSSVFTPPSLVVNNDISALSHQHRSVMQMPDMSLSINEVANCLATLDTSKACDPDNIPPRLLKECTLAWFTDYRSGRSQRVILDGFEEFV